MRNLPLTPHLSGEMAALVWASSFRKDPRWHSSATPSLVLGILIALSLIGLFVGAAIGLGGLTERILEVFIVLWLCFIAWQLFNKSKDSQLSAPS